MKLLKTSIFLLLSAFLPQLASAQTDTVLLEHDPDPLYDAIEEILSYQKREDCLEILDAFKKNIKARKVTEQHYYGLVKLGNAMIKRKMKRFNYFRNLVATINIFANNNPLTVQYFDTWIDISIKILNDQPKGKTKNFESSLGFFKEFWANKNLYKISKGSHTWKAENTNFKMTYEDKKLKIAYDNTRLFCFNKNDSLTITDARGIYFPMESKWIGAFGRIEWNQEGAMDAYAEIKQYTINAKHTAYECENAILKYPSVFKKAITGKVRDRIIRRSRGNLRYPRFESNSRNINIEDIGEGVNYVGGFVMEGALVRGFGDEEGKSTVYIKNNKDQVVAKIVAVEFDINRGERVVSKDSEVVLYINHEDGTQDSIYHPSIKFIYDIQARKLEVERGETRASGVGFFNSMQQIEMNTNQLTWEVDTDQIEIGDNMQNMEMASESNFDEGLYEKYQNITRINPIIKFSVYSQKLEQSESEGFVPDDPVDPYSTSPTNVSDDEFCKMYPELCAPPDEEPELEIDTIPEKDIQEPDPIVIEEFDPRTIEGDMIAKLLDPRMDQVAILTAMEVEKASKNPAFKVMKNNKDYLDFKKNYPRKYKFAIIDVNDISEYVNDPPPSHDLSTTLSLYLEMTKDGFLVYNKVDSTITLRDKIFHYMKASNIKNVDHDFDKIKIKSVPAKNSGKDANATLDLKKGSVETRGVQYFTLSDSQQVSAQPFGGIVEMKEGRDMDFDGILKAGFCNFTGTGFHFMYDIFHIEMDTIDFIDIYIYERARHGEDAGRLAGRPKKERLRDDMTEQLSTLKEPINSVIEGTQGLLLIDIPSNKSGRQESDPIYPSFEALTTSKVYYDRNNRQGEGIYPRETFYHELDKFILNGLDKLEPEALNFPGKFYSADIFPSFTENCRVMYHDLSLGFETETPGNEGYPIYLREDPDKGKGTFQGDFGMSNEGLIGNGRLDYLGSTIESEYIEFLPEQFKTDEVDSFNLEESVTDGVEFPKIRGEKVKIDWAPYEDSMYIESAIVDGVPFEFFDSDSSNFTLEGSIMLTPKGVLGRGTFDWEEATLESNPGGDFKFGRNSINSLAAAVIIKSQEEEFQKFAFENDNVEATIDFDKQVGDFISNEKDLSTDLPYNSYKTSLDRFHWDMQTDHIYMETTQGKTGFFLATEQSQDSLFFLGEKADYDLNTGLLMIDGIDFIRVADAFIYPKDRHVEIEESSHMRTLEDSKIVADTANKNHVIQRASINVLSRREYKADGFLEFNVEGHKEQEIEFSNVLVKQEGGKYITTGSGTVMGEDDFFLDKRTRFKGDVSLRADSKNLFFKGYAKISSKVLPVREWFGIDSKIDKKDVSIFYDKPQNPEGLTLHVGLYMNVDSAHLYPSILAPKKNITDRSIFSTSGVLKFDNQKEVYMFGDSAKVLGESVPGKLLTVFEKNAKVVAEGPFDFNEGFNREGMPTVGVNCVGNFSFFLDKASDYRFDVSTNLDFYMPQALLDIITGDLTSNQDQGDNLLYSSVKNIQLERQLNEFIQDEKAFAKMWKRVKDEERLTLPQDFAHTFFFVNNPLVWSDKTLSFVTKSSTLQLASIKGKHIGQVVRGHLEILMDPARGDAFNFYIISPGGDWYFYSYQMGFVKTASSNPEYNNMISSLKVKDRRVKASNGRPIEIIISSSAEYSAFKNRASSAH
ncbi:MAG: hypothetical protein GY810_29530 [Aureispira sp.]|nr:hypothetical protein [Aureispira sp.]